MPLTYIGYGTTDSNGIAKLDHDANGNVIDGYTGTGEGNITLVASTDSNPSASSILSNRVDVYDAPSEYNVDLVLSSNTVNVNDAVILSATLTEDGDAITGATITFKRGTTVIGTAETNEYGIAIYNYTANVGGVFSMTAVYNTSISTAQSLTVNKKNTLLSINVPQLIITDEFDITGVLTDSNSNAIANATVKLYWKLAGGNAQSTSATTNSNGEVNFHRTEPTSSLNYQFWLEFEGDDTYNNSASSVETRTPEKDTSVLTVTSPVNNSEYYSDASITVAGTLYDNDGEVINGFIEVKEGSTVLGSFSARNGTFSGTILESLSVGSHSLTIEYGGDLPYNPSTFDVDITIKQPDLSAGDDILSYADGDSTVFIAEFGKSGQTVKLCDASDDSEIGTMVDEGDGVYSYDYDSQGVGDITFYAKYTALEGTYLTKTYAIEDCIKAGFNNWTGTVTTGTDTYDYITPTSTGVSPNVSLPSAFKVNYKFKNMRNDADGSGSGLWNIGADTNNGVLIGHEGTDLRIRIYSRSGGSNTPVGAENNVYNSQTWTDAELTYNNDTISITVGGKTISYSLSSTNIMQLYSSYTNMRMAEFKIKPL